MFLEDIFRIGELFSKFPYKFFAIALHDVLGLKNSLCHSLNHSPELRCMLHALFTLVVTLELHCSQPIRSRLFFSCVLVDVYRARVFGNGKSKPRSLKVNWSIIFFLERNVFR